MQLAIALIATCVALAAEGSSGFDEAALQQKYGFEWVQHALEHAKEGADTATQHALEVSKKVGDVTSSAVGSLQSGAMSVANLSSSLTGDVTQKGKLVAIQAVMMYLGKCPDYYASIPQARKAVAPKLAEALEQAAEDPSKGSQFCAIAVREGIDSSIAAFLKDGDSQEQIALKWISEDRAHKVCSDELMRELEVFECIRKQYPRQYREALHTKLLYNVFTEELIANELDRICGSQRVLHRHDVRLFSVGGGAPQPAKLSPAALSAWTALAVFAAAAGLFAALALRRSRGSCGGAGAAAAVLAEEPEPELELALVERSWLPRPWVRADR